MLGDLDRGTYSRREILDLEDIGEDEIGEKSRISHLPLWGNHLVEVE